MVTKNKNEDVGKSYMCLNFSYRLKVKKNITGHKPFEDVKNN